MEEQDPILDYTPSQEQNNPQNQVASLEEAIKAKYPLPKASGGVSSQEAIDPFDAPVAGIGSAPKRPTVSFSETIVDPNEIYTQLSDGSYQAKYKNYITGTDNNERLAQQQTTGEKWKNGTLKALTNVGTTVLGNTVGSVIGLGELISTGSVEAMYNNDFNQWLNQVNEELRYELPNYYTKQEQQEGFFESLDNANFWANDFLGGLSFTVGTIIGEAIWTAATGGAGLAGSGARMAARAGFRGFDTAADLAKANSAAARVGKKLLRSGQFSAQGARNVGRAIEGANTLRFTYTSAAYEAGVEASTYMREAKKNYLYTFEQQHGRQPSPEEYAEFIVDLEGSANTVFATNTALVGASNLAVLGSMFDLPSPLSPISKSLNKNLFGIGARSTTREGRTVLETLKPTKLQKFAGHSNAVLKSAVVEGVWEEGMQAVTSNGAESWLASRYDQDATKKNLDMIGAAYDGLAHTYGTKEGWKEVGLGMLIGLVGGGMAGHFNDYSNAQKDMKNKVAEMNTYSAENVLETLQTQNQISKASKDLQEATAKNDLLGKDLATKRLLYSNARANIRFGKTDAVEDFKAAMEGLDDSYYESLGLDPESETFEQEKAGLKSNLVEQYQNVQKQYKTNRKTAEYMVGKGGLAGVDNTEALIEAVAYNITMGENADQFASQAFEAIEEHMTGEMATKVKGGVKIQTTLENAHKRTRERFYYHRKRAKKAERDLENALKALRKLETQNRETNIGLDQKIQKAQQEINDHTKTMEEEKTLMRQTYAMAQAENHYKSTDEGGAEVILDEDLLETEKNLEAGEEYLENLKETNPTKYQAIKKLFEEYHRANYAFRQFNNTVQGLANDELKLKEYNDFISKRVHKGKENNEFTQQWINENLEAYQRGQQESVGDFAGTQAKVQADRRMEIEEKLYRGEELNDSEKELYEMYKEEVDKAVKVRKVGEKMMNQDFLEGDDLEFYNENKAEVDAFIAEKEQGDKITPPKPKAPQPTTLKERIKRAIDNDTAVQAYVGKEVDDVINKKPTVKETEEFGDLDSRKKATQTGGGRRPDPNVEPLTEEEEARHEELLTKLANWRIADGSIDPEGYSLADLIRAKEQEETEPQKENVNPELTEEEMIKLEAVSEKDASRTREEVNYVQTYENVKVKVAKDKNVYVFSHLNIGTILGHFSMDNITYKAPTGKDKGQLTPTKLNQFGKREGTRFEVTLQDGSKIHISISEHGRIAIPIEDFNKIQDKLGFKLVNTNLTKNTYFDVYEEVELQGEKRFVPKKSDFTLTTITGAPEVVLQPQELEKLEEGDELTFEVNPKSVFNNTLLDKIQETPEDKRAEKFQKEIEDTLEIYVKTSDGRVVGVVKAMPSKISKNSKSQPNHRALRQHAAKLFLEQANTMSTEPIDLGATIPVTTVLLGTPNLELQDSQDGLTPVNIEITDKALEQISDFGYMEEGKLKTRGNTDLKNVITSPVRSLSKEGKVPFVVFNYGKRKIAYPVSLVTTKDFDGISRIQAINNAEKSAGEKILEINEVLLENGISPRKYGLMNTPANEIDNKIDQIMEELSEREVSPDLDNWVENADKSILKGEARISIDLTNRPLKSPKLMVNFPALVLPTTTSEAEAGAEVDVANKNEIKNQQNENC